MKSVERRYRWVANISLPGDDSWKTSKQKQYLKCCIKTYYYKLLALIFSFINMHFIWKGTIVVFSPCKIESDIVWNKWLPQEHSFAFTAYIVYSFWLRSNIHFGNTLHCINLAEMRYSICEYTTVWWVFPSSSQDLLHVFLGTKAIIYFR